MTLDLLGLVWLVLTLCLVFGAIPFTPVSVGLIILAWQFKMEVTF